jgi:hypothetical protein
MKPRLTSYYDPADPPRASRGDEANRLLGKALPRASVYFIYVYAVGGDPLHALISLIEIGGWKLAGGLVILLWAVAPLAVGLEHLLMTDDAADN